MCELMEFQCSFCKAAVKKQKDNQEALVEMKAKVEEDGQGQDVVVKRVTSGGINRLKNIGIHTIEIYYPQMYCDQFEMEVFDSSEDRFGPGVIGKYTKGIGQLEFRFVTDDEDPVSFGMTVIHRLMERMSREAWNQTHKYSDDGRNLNPWNAIGCFNVGTESLIDRSKSMKAYMMDLFERYGNEANIEGVDHYNACYGGQAAFFNVTNWVDSDKWDGRYGLAIATDISDAEGPARFSQGAASTGTLVYPEAPAVMVGPRSTAILHRFDFFKPVGWHAMAPLVDGKYSIECYMQCIDMCGSKMKEKRGGAPLMSFSDFNVFHTGGGFHVVRKAFERFVRNEAPSSSKDERQKLFDDRCAPSCHLLTRVGPCHTVSSFLNIFSVCSSTWDKGIGKTILVFTYGSGATASMYTLRMDDLLYAEPLQRWLVEFYRNAIKSKPEKMMKLADEYENTWMRFGWKPQGRKQNGVSLNSYELDVYYLMEIDGWGRRFYHRGGIRGEPLSSDQLLHADTAEDRQLYDGSSKPEPEEEKEKPLEERWKELEYEMTYEPPLDPDYDVIEESYDRNNTFSTFKVVKDKEGKKKEAKTLAPDGLPHTYQIVGTWTRKRKAEEMTQERDAFTFVVTVGENCWEQFYLIQDNDWKKKIYPAMPKSWKGMPCVGPHNGGEGHYWMLDGRDMGTVPDMDKCWPGDKFKVTFTWKKLKDLTWQKLEDASTQPGDSPVPSLPTTPRDLRGKYYISGSWSCFGLEEMEPDPRREGVYTIEVPMTSLGGSFQLVRDEDWNQIIYPHVGTSGMGTPDDKVMGPDDFGNKKNWVIEPDELGDVYEVEFHRNPEEYDDMSVTWRKVRHGEIKEPAPRYFYAGTSNNFGKEGHHQLIEFAQAGEGIYTVEVECLDEREEFQIVVDKMFEKSLRPDCKQVTSNTKHEVMGPGAEGKENRWVIGGSAQDRFRQGDIFEVKLESHEGFKVSWKRLREGKKFQMLKLKDRFR